MDRICNGLEKIFNVVLFFMLAVTVLVLGANIAGRYLFEYSIVWSNNLARYAYIYIVLLGTAISYKLDLHAVITIAHDAVPGKMKIVFDVLHYAAMMFLSVVLIVPGTKHVILMWPVEDPMLSFSLGVIYLSVPISAIAILLFVVSRVISLLRKPGVAQ
jgi:TRAP-type C4-dicarboxylate transport system permease small subunit